MGYLDNKHVCDVGCGYGQHLTVFCSRALSVTGIDPLIEHMRGHLYLVTVPPNKTVEQVNAMLKLYPWSIFEVSGSHFDVITAIEVFEHVDACKFIDKIAALCDYAFITTPLAKVTGPTRNSGHIAEYSDKDFDTLVGQQFDILSKKYQYPDLAIKDTGEPIGCSMDPEHIVQMVWCKRKMEVAK